MRAMATGTLLTVAPTGAETDKSDAPALPVSLDPPAVSVAPERISISVTAFAVTL